MLSKYGAKVIICARDLDALKQTSECIQNKGGICSYQTVDICQEKEVDSFAQNVLDNYGRVDILVNNAGLATYHPLMETTSENWDRTIDTNLRGTFLCSRAFGRIMLRQNSGYIMNIASKAGKHGMKNLSAYCASKFGVVGLTESMKEELKPFGIKVYCVCPTYVRTDFFNNFPENFSLPPTSLQPENVAEQVLRILTDDRKIRAYAAKVFHRRAF